MKCVHAIPAKALSSWVASTVCFGAHVRSRLERLQEPFVAATAAQAGESRPEVPQEVRINSVHQDQVGGVRPRACSQYVDVGATFWALRYFAVAEPHLTSTPTGRQPSNPLSGFHNPGKYSRTPAVSCAHHQLPVRATKPGQDSIKQQSILAPLKRGCSSLREDTLAEVTPCLRLAPQVLEAPPGARVLATSRQCPVEMFALGDNVFGMQGDGPHVCVRVLPAPAVSRVAVAFVQRKTGARAPRVAACGRDNTVWA